MPPTLHSFTLNLLTDPQAMSAFQHDPMAALAQAGLADLTPQDVQEVIPLVMDSVRAGTGNAYGGFGTNTPLGEVASVGELRMEPDGPRGDLGVWSDHGDVGVAASDGGFTVHGTGSFAGLGNGLPSLPNTPGLPDMHALDGLSAAGAYGMTEGAAFLTRTMADGAMTTGGIATAGAGALGTDLTPGANTAASLLAAGASSMAGLLGTGANLTAGMMTDPAGTVASTVDTAHDGLAGGNLPVDVPNVPDVAGVPNLPDLSGLPADPAGGLPQLPAAPGLPLPALPGVPALPQLPLPPLQLPVQLPEVPAVTTQPVHASADGTASASGSASTDGVTQSPLGTDATATPDHAVTDLLHDVTHLDAHLPLF
jgi:hypothetical protein